MMVVPRSAPRPDSKKLPPLQTVPQTRIPESYASHLKDESRLQGGHAEGLLFAHSEEQILRAIEQVHEKKSHLTLSAGRTGIVGGAVPLGGFLLSLERMDRVLGAAWSEDDQCWRIRVEPGMTLARLQEGLDRRNLPFSSDGGEITEECKAFLEQSSLWFYAPDPTEQSAHLGGTAATNASGSRSFRYGATRRHLTGLRVMLSDGTLLEIKRGDALLSPEQRCRVDMQSGPVTFHHPVYRSPKIKSVAGYQVEEPLDLIDLFIGSEGTLGVLTEVEVRLTRKPPLLLAGISFFDSGDRAFECVFRIREAMKTTSGICPDAIEFFDRHSLNLLRGASDPDAAFPIPPDAAAAVFFEQAGSEETLDDLYSSWDALLNRCGTGMEKTWGGVDAGTLERLRTFRHAVPEKVNQMIGALQRDCPDIHKISSDFAVPDQGLSSMMDFYRSRLQRDGLNFVIFGHIGENHLHVNILPKNTAELSKARSAYQDMAERAVALGGTVSAEHGIGKLKKKLMGLMYKPDALCEMRHIKAQFDPSGILCRGNIF
ncbi:FAD-binding oxidoreductase [bacterium]|nr:FAD-binding oxidoreductase [bacterium]